MSGSMQDRSETEMISICTRQKNADDKKYGKNEELKKDEKIW